MMTALTVMTDLVRSNEIEGDRSTMNLWRCTNMLQEESMREDDIKRHSVSPRLTILAVLHMTHAPGNLNMCMYLPSVSSGVRAEPTSSVMSGATRRNLSNSDRRVLRRK